LLLLAMPVIAFLALFVIIDGGPLFHRRRVVGRDGPFDALKIRSMIVDADGALKRQPELEKRFKENFKLQNDPRITRVGRFLRKFNLDELPQFWNVVRGEMSLVGPRMKTSEEVERYGSYKEEVLSMRPGITGYWQVTVRHKVSYEERIELDLYYVRNWSLRLDCWILLRTAAIVFGGKGD
jgi:lipopolysaccharide/colanic/teichoic acid biosynthesis glycosyltransferase